MHEHATPAGKSEPVPHHSPHGRRTSEVIRDHLQLRRRGDLEEDLRRNYHPDVVLLSAEGVHHGHEGVRKLAAILRSYVPAAGYRYRQVLDEGPYAMLRWSARGQGTTVHDGADSYVVASGLIVAQTIHYSTGPPPAQDR
ncbi:nuclear transport factor 2 family protein [Nonomuraea sp. SYSU D8015]|uniref:nuclear transport factor 2 family protein n=1 Tax=Nonomuraea sp. SYSU D8015 TaxID=2593644 RepID=UPI0016607380|nr:nuclear transport factor 2 family protein [Nonomuraea sp. SYSU D8015]